MEKENYILDGKVGRQLAKRFFDTIDGGKYNLADILFATAILAAFVKSRTPTPLNQKDFNPMFEELVEAVTPILGEQVNEERKLYT